MPCGRATTFLVIALALGFAAVLPSSSSSSLGEPQRRRPAPEPPDFSYHNEEWLDAFLHRISTYYRRITHLYSIGRSVKDRDLKVLAIGQSPKEHVSLRPEVKFIGNIHGNEAVTRELLIQLIYYLVSNYKKIPEVTHLLNTTRIHILVTMNPDGYYVAERKGHGDCHGVYGRNNFNNQDLNRNFPDYFVRNPGSRQPETRAVMRWMKDQQFVLSASFHSGALLVNYPYDNLPAGYNRPMYHATKDDDLFVDLARAYSSAHKTMHKAIKCPGDRLRFHYGIVNGASWYLVKGSMQDYNYIYAGCVELTIEVACCKFPEVATLREEWEKNRNPLMILYSRVHSGVKGILLGPDGSPLKGIAVEIEGRDHPTNTTALGEFWRLLLDGKYTLRIKVPGYPIVRHTFNIPPTREDFQSDFFDPYEKRPPYTVSTYLDDSQVTVLKIQVHEKEKKSHVPNSSSRPSPGLPLRATGSSASLLSLCTTYGLLLQIIQYFNS